VLRRIIEYTLLGLTLLLWIAQLFLPDQGVGFVTGIVVFLIVWWMVFFAVLPLRVRSQLEEDNVEPGSEPGAPTDPRIKARMWLTTVITSGLWLVYVFGFEFGLVNLDMFPSGQGFVK